MTNERDLVNILERHGPPPSMVWVTCGNTSNARMREILSTAWPLAVGLLEQGEPLVEITDATKSPVSLE
jgi:predicted nuclease of predicted toxin-antitoxin system